MTTELTPSPNVKLAAVCHDCRRRHEYNCHASEMLTKMGEWKEKHNTHRIEFFSPEREMLRGHKPSAFRRMMKWFDKVHEETQIAPWWMEFAPNADIKLAYVGSADYIMSLGAMSTSPTLLFGRESTAIDNTANLYLDYLVGGTVMVGTSPTADKSIQAYLYGSIDDTPTYPAGMTGTDAAASIANGDVRNSGMNYLSQTSVRATTGVAYWFRPTAISASFGGIVPKFHGLWVTHDTEVNLDASSNNNQFTHTGTYVTSV